MVEKDYLIWLAHLYDVSAYNMDMLMDYFGNACEIYNAKEKDFAAIPDFSKKFGERILQLQKNIDINELTYYMEEKSIDFISKYDKDFPPLLKGIDNPPFGLFYIGKIPDFEKIWVNIVGARKCTSYGKYSAYELGKNLAEYGAVITSGMAMGSDSFAHKGALDANGETVAVLGCGVDICYPKENSDIYSKIVERACVVSEFPPKIYPKPWHFPMRNRIMSGLCLATVVVEAGLKSGTMISVECALSQGREVCAVPGNITSKLSAGTNRIIKEGAHIVTCAEDVLDALGFLLSINEQEDETPEPLNSSYDETDLAVLKCISKEPVTLDEIMLQCNLPFSKVQYSLTKFEISGKIRKLQGQRYIK